MPRRSSWLSPAFGPNTVSASSSSSVGGSSPIERTSAAGLMFTVSSGSWQVASMMSSSLLLPHRLTGLVTSSRGAQFHAGAACVAAIHSTIASAASGEGSTTYRVSACVQLVEQPGADRRPVIALSEAERRWCFAVAFRARQTTPAGGWTANEHVGGLTVPSVKVEASRSL